MSTVSEKLLQVAENVPKVYHAGQLNIIENAECLKGSKSGSAILIDDVSPVTHDMGVKVRGKNLLNQSTTELGTLERNYDRTNIRDFEDNTWYAALAMSGYYDPNHRMPEYTLNGENIKVKTGVGGSAECYGLAKSLQCKPNTTYTLSYDMENGLTQNASAIGFYGADKKNISFVYCDSGSSFTTPSNCYWITVCFHGNDTNTYVTYSNIQLELGTTATEYEPYINPTSVTVSRCGKNLFNSQLLLAATGWSVDENGVYSGLPQALYKLYHNGIPTTFKAGIAYTLSFYAKADLTTDTEMALYIVVKYTDGTESVLMVDNTEYKMYTITSTKDIDCINFTYNQNRTTYIKDFMLEIGSTASDYEPYVETEYTPNSDGTVEGVTSLYPNTTLTTDTDGIYIDCEYYKDIDKAYNKLSAEIALSGGE